MKRPALIVLILAVLGVGGWFASQNLGKAGQSGELTQYKLAKAETGGVKKTVSASGVLQPWRVVDIKSRAGGEVQKMAVDVGSEVTKNQILARIDPTDTLLSYNTARADVDSARARESQSDRTYQLQTQQTRISIATAEANLASSRASLAATRASLQSALANNRAAQARLNTANGQSGAQPALTKAAIANAKASYNQAVKQRKQLDSTNLQNKATAKAAYDQAIANRDNAKLTVNRQAALVEKGFVSQQAVDTAQATLNVNEAQVINARARLDNIDAELLAGQETADARVEQTRAALATAQANAVDVPNRQNSAIESQAAFAQSNAQVAQARAQVAQSEAQVTQVSRALEQARANAANNAIRRFDVAAAQATIARSSAQLANSKVILTQTTVRSPADGVVLKKYVEEGTIIQSGQSGFTGGTAIVQLGDISKMYVDVKVDETDVANVDVDQKVEVNAESYPGVQFEGKVVRVDPQALVEQNVTTISVRVEIDNSSPTYRLLKPGMNCTCEFIVGERESVVTVPNEAVKENEDGTKYVEVASGGKPAPPDPKTGAPADAEALVDVTRKKETVEVGLEGNEAVEITKGLKEGTQVVIQTIEPVTPAAGASGSPFGGGGAGGRGGGGGGFGRR